MGEEWKGGKGKGDNIRGGDLGFFLKNVFKFGGGFFFGFWGGWLFGGFFGE
jgi:hypothetical protein